MNYINKISIYGLMNKNCLIDDSSYENSFWKNKSKTKLVKLVDYKDYKDILKELRTKKRELLKNEFNRSCNYEL